MGMQMHYQDCQWARDEILRTTFVQLVGRDVTDPMRKLQCELPIENVVRSCSVLIRFESTLHSDLRPISNPHQNIFIK